jgi:hypothetical protein
VKLTRSGYGYVYVAETDSWLVLPEGGTPYLRQRWQIEIRRLPAGFGPRVGDRWLVLMQPGYRRRWVRKYFPTLAAAKAFVRSRWAADPDGAVGELDARLGDDAVARRLLDAAVEGDQEALAVLSDRGVELGRGLPEVRSPGRPPISLPAAAARQLVRLGIFRPPSAR